MLNITPEFKENVIAALLKNRENFTGADAAFAKQYGIAGPVFSRLKNGERDGLIRDQQYLNIGRELNVSANEIKWNIARTDVLTTIEEDVNFCQNYSKAMIFVDECDIGKTTAGTYFARTRKNCFYIDASECKTRQLFIRSLAKRIGVDHNGKYADVKANLKYYLKQLPQPLIIIDEAGDLEYSAFLELKEFWNATENTCGWYMMGAEGLMEKINRGIRNKKVGNREIFRRFGGNYSHACPLDSRDKQSYFQILITQVLEQNTTDKSIIPGIVKKSLIQNELGTFAGLTRAKSLLLIHNSN